MKEFSYVIQDNEGIHARPAGLLVKEAQKYAAEVKLQKAGKLADAKKIFSVMSLAAKKGETVTVQVTGSDEETCVHSLQSFFKENL